MVVDLKTTVDASEGAFARSANTYRYFVQDPWYCDVIRTAIGEAPSHFVFLAIEKDWPHAIGIYFLDDEDVDRGRKTGRRDLHRIIQWRDAQDWPDYATHPKPIALPIWARQQIDMEI
jgi:hypothetical protein